MKLKYKKLIIIISIGALFLSFLILTLIPTGGDNSSQVEDAALNQCDDEEINTLISNYLQAKRDVDMEAIEPLVSDINRIDQEKFIKLAEYVEDYQNIVCYTLENEENGAARVYVRYDMKLKNIETLAPCLSGFYVTLGSDGKKLIYLSALEETEEEFLLSADKNSHVTDLQKEVSDQLKKAIDGDPAFRDLYQKMDQEIKESANAPAASGNPAAEPAGNQQPAEQAPNGQQPAEQAPNGQQPAEQAPNGQQPAEQAPTDQQPIQQSADPAAANPAGAVQ